MGERGIALITVLLLLLIVTPLAAMAFLQARTDWLLERNLLYTAVTRGKKLVIIIGQVKALAMAVKNRRSTKRVTKLAERIVRNTN